MKDKSLKWMPFLFAYMLIWLQRKEQKKSAETKSFHLLALTTPQTPFQGLKKKLETQPAVPVHILMLHYHYELIFMSPATTNINIIINSTVYKTGITATKGEMCRINTLEFKKLPVKYKIFNLSVECHSLNAICSKFKHYPHCTARFCLSDVCCHHADRGYSWIRLISILVDISLSEYLLFSIKFWANISWQVVFAVCAVQLIIVHCKTWGILAKRRKSAQYVCGVFCLLVFYSCLCLSWSRAVLCVIFYFKGVLFLLCAVLLPQSQSQP